MENNWISVKDRLPEFNSEDDFLVVDTTGEMFVCFWFLDKWVVDADSHWFANATHWMPLPNPPKP